MDKKNKKILLLSIATLLIVSFSFWFYHSYQKLKDTSRLTPQQYYEKYYKGK
jgi:hypothetical protein